MNSPKNQCYAAIETCIYLYCQGRPFPKGCRSNTKNLTPRCMKYLWFVYNLYVMRIIFFQCPQGRWLDCKKFRDSPAWQALAILQFSIAVPSAFSWHSVKITPSPRKSVSFSFAPADPISSDTRWFSYVFVSSMLVWISVIHSPATGNWSPFGDTPR